MSCVCAELEELRRSCESPDFGAATKGAAKELHFPPYGGKIGRYELQKRANELQNHTKRRISYIYIYISPLIVP